MATIGQVLTAPETGWKRYDDNELKFLYNGSWLIDSTNSTTAYNSAVHYTSSPSAYVKFKFYGSKIRIIGSIRSYKRADNIINIDGIDYIFSEYNENYSSSQNQSIVFEKLDLTNSIHTIKISSPNLNGSTGQDLVFDAIDIDDAGYLAHPILNEVHNISYIKNFGDCIPCKYTALTSGSVGMFNELGVTAAAFIPPTSSATPDGSFYWIYVGKDYLGRKKFIADRNIQKIINWDALNSAGVCNENVIDLGLGNSYKTSIRLLTGGISATDTDNEWDKIIVGSTLNNTTTAGDANIWNTNASIRSLTSSTNIAGNVYRTTRGYTLSSDIAYSSTPTASSLVGFRPVLLVESLITNKFLIKKDSNYYSIKPEYYDESIHAFIPLTLTGGADPNTTDIENFGFDDLNSLITPMITGSDNFKPIDKIVNCEIKCYVKN